MSYQSLLGVGRRKDGDTHRDRKKTAGGPAIVTPEPRLAGRPAAPSRTGPVGVWSQAVSRFGQNSSHTGVGVLSSPFSSVPRRPRWWNFGGRCQLGGWSTRDRGEQGHKESVKAQLKTGGGQREVVLLCFPDIYNLLQPPQLLGRPRNGTFST